jgi:site-specific recombinase XerD
VCLFQYFQQKMQKPHYLIDYKEFTPTMFDDFVLWLERERNYSAASKRQRLSAITSFMKYASRRDVAALSALNSAATTETSRIPKVHFPYFSLEETGILLRLPNTNTKTGQRDLALLSLLYETAARAQEICDICAGDIRFGSSTKVTLHGKGSKIREVPIADDVANLLRWHMKHESQNLAHDRNVPLFESQRGGKMTTATIRHLTDKYVLQAITNNPTLFPEPKYSPHSWRHSKAVHMAEAGVPLIYIRNFLGHATTQSTEIYARISQAAVSKALTERSIPQIAPKRPVRTEKSEPVSLPAFLLTVR